MIKRETNKGNNMNLFEKVWSNIIYTKIHLASNGQAYPIMHIKKLKTKYHVVDSANRSYFETKSLDLALQFIHQG